MEIKLYTIGCPKCKILEEKIKAKNISIDIIEDVEELKETGIEIFPVLEVDGEKMEFYDAITWVNNYVGE